MTSRRLIRIKVLQLLYSYVKNDNVSQAEIERDLLKVSKKVLICSFRYFYCLLISDKSLQKNRRRP